MGAALNELIKGLREKAAFAGSIGKNVFDSDFKPLSNKDILGNSLLRMRDSLVQASEEAEIRRIENYERSWASQGIAEFNEIIREHNDSIEDFTSVIISKLTKYLDAQLGGLYILNDENPKDTFLELSAFYAYDRQKFISKQIKPGENLVGQSLIEEDTIFITDIPENYVNITSGLGKDTPKSLLIVPLKLNEKIHGVVELASFNVFKPYQIEFVEKTGEILASTIANININIKTSKLLGESNEKSERLALQEAESHRNLEKLQRTLNEKTEKENQLNLRLQKIDEEFKSQIKRLENRLEQTNKLFEQQTLESKSYLEILNHSLLVVEVNQNGEILNANKKFLKTSGVLMVDITGTSIYDYYSPAHESSSDYIELKKNMFEGKPFTLSTTYIFDNKEIYLYETHTPLRNSKGDIYKIIITSALENN
jgi:PAS domain-containing protein